MRGNMFIPKTITVGFNNRSDTFTGKLAYIIYTDEKGKLRKESSWNSWRNKNIEAVTFDNTPQPNFTFNKGVQRDGHWGSGRSVIRVYDQRDFEFEISVDNLIGLLMHSDVSKRDITEPCVFAWYGTELVLLPTNSVEYQESMKYTNKQSLKITAKELVPGRTYSLKKDPHQMVYMGHFERYESASLHTTGEKNRSYYDVEDMIVHRKKSSKAHMFYNLNTNQFENKNPTTHLAECVDENIREDYASLMDKYYLSAESQPAKDLRVKVDSVNSWYRTWMELEDNVFVQLNVPQYNWHRSESVTIARYGVYDPATSTLNLSHSGSRSYYGNDYVAPKTISISRDAISKAEQVSRELTAAVNRVAGEIKAAGGDWQQQDQLQKSARTQMYNAYSIGNLQYILADGKKANDNFI